MKEKKTFKDKVGCDIKKTFVERDSSQEKRLYFEGVFQHEGIVNKNNRVYPKSIWEKNLKEGSEFMERLENMAVLGELEHPEDGITSLRRVSHQFLEVKRMEDGKIWAKGRVLNTEEGRRIAELLAVDYPLGASSRGDGTSESTDDGREVVNDDYILETFDFVEDPSVPTVETHVVTEDTQDKLEEANCSPVTIYEQLGCDNGDNVCVIEELEKRKDKKKEDNTESEIDIILDFAEGNIEFEEAISKLEDKEAIQKLLRVYKINLQENSEENSCEEKDDDHVTVVNKENKMNDKQTKKLSNLVTDLVEKAKASEASAKEAEAKLEELKEKYQEDGTFDKKYDNLKKRYEASKSLLRKQVKPERYEAAKKVAEDLLNEKEKIEKSFNTLKERYRAAKKLIDGAIAKVKKERAKFDTLDERYEAAKKLLGVSIEKLEESDESSEDSSEEKKEDDSEEDEKKECTEDSKSRERSVRRRKTRQYSEGKDSSIKSDDLMSRTMRGL